MRDKNKAVKFISFLIIILIIMPAVLFSRPKQAEAFWFSTWVTDIMTGKTSVESSITMGSTLTNTGISIANVAKAVLTQVVMTVERRLLQQITKSTINWINSGFHGAPLFVENPGSFFKDIAKFEVKNLVTLFGYDNLKYPFGQAFALNTIDAYKRQLADNAQYTLSKVINDPVLLSNYQNNFNVGGWNGFLINTQYPQNNYLGFQMLATAELARQLQGTSQNAAQKIQTTLQQGMGFLSPQTCPSNPAYNNLQNEFQQPEFQAPKYTPPPADASDYTDSSQTVYTPEYQAKRDAYQTTYNTQYTNDYGTWAEKNDCPEGLVNTTPGSVVANQITSAMGSQFRQTELAAAMGNSISAVLDALVNHFLDKGLNALASTVNPKAPTDNWTYNGQTLGSPVGGANSTWDSGPDQPLILTDFKKLIGGKTVVTNTDGTTREDIGDTGNGTFMSGDMSNTQTELQLMDNDSATNPGIIQLIGQIWPKARELDICQPGPDIGWQDRMDGEVTRNSKLLEENLNSDNGDLSAKADATLKELLYAVNFFKDWINNKMLTALPHSILYMDAVDQIKNLSQESDELINNRRIKTQALARLQAINSALAAFTTQPNPGSSEEKALVSLKKQYDATLDTVSNNASIENSRNELAVAKDKLATLNKLVTQCTAERAAGGWSNPGGLSSTFNGSGGAVGVTSTPALSASSHGNDPGAPSGTPNVRDINFQNLGSGVDMTTWTQTGTLNSVTANNANLILDFNVPSTWEYVMSQWIIVWRGGRWVAWPYDQQYTDKSHGQGVGGIVCGAAAGGQTFGDFVPKAGETYYFMMSTYARHQEDVTAAINTHERTNILPLTWPAGISLPNGCSTGGGSSASGTEKQLFCDTPIVSGYSHGSFTGPDSISPKLPMVNATDVLNWRTVKGTILQVFCLGLCGGAHHVDIQLSCNTIFRANVLDYKGNIPGLTTVTEPYVELPADTTTIEPTVGGPACTQTGTDEQNFILPLLNGGTLPQDAATQTNQRFGLTTGGEAVFYPDSNTVGLPEFYAAGPTATRPVSPATGQPWDIVVRCDSTGGTGGGVGVPAPADAATKHGNHETEVAEAKQALVNSGMTFSTSSSACDRFAITRDAARRIGGDAGVLDKPGGSNCVVNGNGYAQDIIAFPDGYIYDVLNGTAPDGNGPGWSPTGCGTAASNGTCADRYRPTL